MATERSSHLKLGLVEQVDGDGEELVHLEAPREPAELGLLPRLRRQRAGQRHLVLLRRYTRIALYHVPCAY